MAVGRISGPLLKANLLRNGVDLAFETNLLYLDVNNLRIGVKTNTPTHELTVNGTTRTTRLETTDELTIGDITVSGNTIETTASQLTLNPIGADPVVYQQKLVVDTLDIEANSITSNTADTDIELSADGTGQVKIFSNTLINGNLHATGTITADGGTITLGDSNTDNVVFNADVNSNILPDQNITYNLGSTSKRWNEVWANTGYVTDVNVTGSFTLNNVDLTLRPGNTLFVSTNGNDNYTGTHQNDPYRTIKKALTVATTGTTIYVYPGVYSEIFPLTVPVGVTIKGGGVRSVTIQPTAGTISQDAFLVNGETTIEDLTISGFRYNSGANTGHAFRFVSNFTVTSRSPYIRNITVITSGSVTSAGDPRGFNQGDAGRGAYLDGSVVNSASKEATMLFHSCTFITPGVDAITATNGVRVEWLNSFTYFASRGFYGLSGSTGFAGAGKTELRLTGTTDTFAVGDVVTYYSTYPTALGTGTISSIASDGKIFLTGKATGFQTSTERGGKIVVPHGNAKVNQSIKKFGTGSLALDGTGDYLTVASTLDFAFGTGAFTLEAWVYNTGISGSNQIIFDFRTTDPSWAPTLYLQASTNTIRLAANQTVLLETAFALLTNTWYHIALSKASGNTRIFINGIQSGSTYTDSNTYIQGPITIGSRFDGTSGFAGYIDDVRISKGIGRYTTNFTAPVSAAANDSYTKLLLRMNGDNNSTTFTDETVLVQDIRSNTGALATGISLVDYSDFGVEVRSIASANVYGTYGVVGSGLGVIMYLIGQNFAYIGTGLRSDNDVSYVIQANETVETGGAKIYYSSVDHKGDFRVGDLFYINQADGTVNFTSANFNVTSSEGLTFSNGVNSTYIDGNEIDTGNLKLSGNTLSSTSGAVNVLSANDQINLLNNVSITGNLDVVGNVTIGGNIIVGDQTTDTISIVAGVNSDIIPTTNNTYDIGSSSLAWQDLFVTTGYVGNISISSNQITTTTTNSNLVISGNGTGSVAVEGLTILNNDISSTANANITLTPNGNGIVEINSVRSLKIPVGTDVQRPGTAQAGMIRFNTTYNRYEGYNGSTWVFLDGLSDLDNNTKITAELTPGANDNTIRFYSDGTLVADLNATRLNVIKVTVDDIAIDGTSITNTAGGNLSLQASGSGSVQIENFAFNGSAITNTLNNSITTFTTTGTGYVKIDGAAGFVIPAGLPGFRPGNPITGMARFDTGAGRLEIYDGATWVSAAGASSGITTADAQDLALQYAIALG